MSTTIALASVEYRGGGEWRYGSWGTCYSNYWHPDEIHGSSCHNSRGEWDTDYNVDECQWSRASVDASLRGNEAYYCIGRR